MFLLAQRRRRGRRGGALAAAQATDDPNDECERDEDKQQDGQGDDDKPDEQVRQRLQRARQRLDRLLGHARRLPTGNLDRLRHQLRDIELQAETQMQSRLAQARDAEASFDPLEFDRFTRVQELTRMMASSVVKA